MPLAAIAPRESSVAACARALRSAILSGEIAVGARLPPERALAETFGVNRVTVRAALSQLEAARLVTVRQGSGYLVRDYKREGGPDLLPAIVALAEDEATRIGVARDLLRVRRQLARAVFEAIAERARAADVTRIKAAVARFAAIAAENPGPARMAEADVEVTTAVVEAAHSAVLALCLNPIAGVVTRFPGLREAMYAAPESNVAGYRALVVWLESRRIDLADLIVAELARRDEVTLAALAKAASPAVTTRARKKSPPKPTTPARRRRS
jgi:GntR family transcriptional regulator, transcriptional repressor for pyruvate dehydrogenase complex